MPGAASASLGLVLHLCLPCRLPLHVARSISPAAGQRHDVVHDVAGPAVRMAALSHEIVLRCLAPVDSSGIARRATGRGPRVRRVRRRLGHLAPRTSGALARPWTLDVWGG